MAVPAAESNDDIEELFSYPGGKTKSIAWK
jgi:hypothetical protein